ncbi:MAG TPA: c-type cytochrome [Xanthomonadales bacterium]|nr:c-type cytochrome [Xanthomonadales bacterium]
MNQSDDRAFIRKFSGIILGLIALTAIILALAFSLRSTPDPDANPSQVRLAEERIAPVAGVHVGEEGQAAVAATAAAAQTAAAQTTTAPAQTETAALQTAAAASPSAAAGGEQIYQTVCMACHAAGVAGAPIPGSAVMQERLAAKGLDGLVSSAINGLNVMPPKGGRPDLSDADIRAAVEFMAH